ncbi:NAD(P)H-hydrate dehydratase [Siculibacillus lacustris]|uniref:Bifunctional NAD(P)H-hydrate repair enzyme n=1 Tax=Siculibacillus lacustris TaxID=1549641 RepID=A0A4Q9VQI3_9HYPH|nr:NAD(P)H-hydrate dehydratase [Siculibacillus lacustris]TBW38069.1 NAD(P)H-hydrate dehydratase [Siculibacillus lacustris]
MELLTPTEMAEADRRTIAAGTPGHVLMEAAGRAVADAVSHRHPVGTRVLVLCGPGNNGGDGFVAARILRDRGFVVRLVLFGTRAALIGDAARAAKAWLGDIEPAEIASVRRALGDCRVVVDALFGAGLSRPLDGAAAALIEAVTAARRPVVAVDLPSGIDGATGRVQGVAIRAELTVTFFRRKPGHLLLPGRLHCGKVLVADIGIPASVLATIRPGTCVDAPPLWEAVLHAPGLGDHKYTRGHAVVVSGPMTRTGAARLAAHAALRAGAGLVTLASPPSAVMVNAAHLTAVMLAPMAGAQGLGEILADPRRNALVLGPGVGLGAETAALVATALAASPALVLDADALTAIAADPAATFAAIRARPAPVIFTPHEGEFARVFPDLAAEAPGAPLAKTARAAAAAVRSGAIVVLKGADTVIAAPDGRVAIADNGPADLATAGSGDVLAGILGGLLARRLPAFEAAAAAVWMHGETGRRAGPGLIAEDLADRLPAVLAELYEAERHRAWAEADEPGAAEAEADDEIELGGSD